MTTTSEAPLGIIGVVDAVTAQLRGRILGGEIRSGDPVTEAAVSQTFGVAHPGSLSGQAAIVQRLYSLGLDGAVSPGPNGSGIREASPKEVLILKREIEIEAFQVQFL